MIEYAPGSPMGYPQRPQMPPHMQPQMQPPVRPPMPPPMPPPRPRRPTGLIVVVAVLFVAAAVFAVLYVLADRDLDLTEASVAAKRTELATATGQVRDATAEQVSLEEDNGALKEENETLQTCVDAVHHYLWDNLTEAERATALDRMFDACQ